MSAVQWRDVAGFPGYEVSEHGDVRRGAVLKKQMSDRKALCPGSSGRSRRSKFVASFKK